MAIKNTTLGGTDWTKNDPISEDNLNDTNGALISIGANTNPTLPPVGAVVAWLKSFTNVPATLPDGWVECDGSVISDADSPMNGETLPDLNGNSGIQRFLRGSTTSGSTGGSESHTHSLPGTYAQGSNSGTSVLQANAGNTGSTSTLPSYYEVVWIMRIK